MLYPLSYEGWSAGFLERLAGEQPNRQPRRPLAAEVMLATAQAPSTSRPCEAGHTPA
jgi:hypothetical protein